MAISQVETISALRSDNPGSEGMRFVKGHTTVGDGGGGIFEWDAASTQADDNGTIIKVDNVTNGRWIRQVDVRGPFHAEWFGAVGDDPARDDSPGIQACLSKLGGVTLLAKRYYVAQVITLPPESDLPRCLIEGQGMDKTWVVSRIPDSPNSYQKAVVFRYPNYQGSEATAVNNAVIRDLTIDCGFNDASQGSRKRTRTAVHLVGEANLVERVKLVNFGVGYDAEHTGSDRPGECFVVYLETYRLTADHGRLGAIRDCVLTQPGTHPDAHEGYPWPEITGLTVGGRDYQRIGVGGSVVGNRVFGVPFNRSAAPYQPSSPHCVTVCNCDGTEVACNEVVNCDGTGVYIGSWTDRNVVVENNRMLGVNKGVLVAVYDSEVQDWHPDHSSMRIEDNLIVVGRTSAPIDTVFAGIFLYSNETTYTTLRLKDIHISRNAVFATKLPTGAGEYVYPKGVYLVLNSVTDSNGDVTFNFDGVAVSDNLLEVPDFTTAGVDTSIWSGYPYENALVFSPAYRYRDSNTEVLSRLEVHGNRNLAGSDVRLKTTHTFDAMVYNYWGILSNRTAQFNEPSFGGRTGVFYDEFLGTLPRSALGWVKVVVPNKTDVVAANGDQGHPGIANLLVMSSAQAGEEVLFKYGANTLSLEGSLRHVFEFGAKRSDAFIEGDASKDYEIRLGLFKAGSSSDGLYFSIKWVGGLSDPQKGTRYNFVVAKARNGAAQASFGPQFWWHDEGPEWHRFRLEITPSPVEGSLMQALFFYDGVPLLLANNTGASNPIPVTALYVGARIAKVSSFSEERSLFLDYFQHQVV